jgi:hypothetical protein
MSIEIDISKVPLDKQQHPRFLEIYTRICNEMSQRESFEEICTHEGAHVFYLQQGGATRYVIDQPWISYDSKTEAFEYAGPSVRAVEWDEQFSKLNELAKLHRMAIAGVAGELATLALLDRGRGTDSGDRQAFRNICEKTAQLIWEAAQKHVRTELQNPDTQAAIRLAAKGVEKRLREL